MSTKTNSPIGNTGATSLPPIVDNFMYVEMSGNNNSHNIFVSFARTDIIQISKITFYSNRFSAGNSKSMERIRIQMFLPNGQWHSKNN